MVRSTAAGYATTPGQGQQIGLALVAGLRSDADRKFLHKVPALGVDASQSMRRLLSQRSGVTPSLQNDEYR